MAARGTKPAATVVQLARGKIRPEDVPKNEPIPEGPCVKLPGMTEAMEAMWDEQIAPLFWLTSADSYKAYMWVTLAVRFRRRKGVISSALIGQLRGLGSELGMDPSSRRRLGTMGQTNDSNSKEADYFNRRA